MNAGYVLGLNGAIGSAFDGEKRLLDTGYMGLLQTDQDVSAVSEACLLTRRSLFERLGGFSEDEFRYFFFDADYCLRLWETGGRVVWTPYATLARHLAFPEYETPDNRTEALRAFYRRWLARIAADPLFNRHFDLTQSNYRLSTDIVIDWDPRFHDRRKVLAVPLPGGSGHYRAIAPLRALSQAGVLQATFTRAKKYGSVRYPNVVELRRSGAEVIYVQNALGDGYLDALASYREFAPDIRVVLSLDDLLTDIPEKSSYKWQFPPDTPARLRRLLGLVDAVVVTTAPLVEMCRPFCDRIHRIPNRLSKTAWQGLAGRHRKAGRPRVGWAGAQQHLGDLEWVAEVVKATRDEVDWVFMGMCPDVIRPYVVEFHPFVLSVDAYPRELAKLDLDLAIAPLEINPFNEAKSNLRLLEYGMLGWPVVCTDILPYQDAPVCRLPNDPRRWIEAIRERVADPEALAEEGRVLKQWVEQHYLLEDHLQEWAEVFLRCPGQTVLSSMPLKL